jgi:NAD(P)H-flavin reductase
MAFEELLTVKRIVQETPDVKSFRLEKKNIEFVPGQYCLASLPDLTENEKPFTFSCSPLRPYVQLTIKKFGEVTTLIHDRLKVGDKLRLRGPFGEALKFDESVKEDIVLIAGGSGITPFMSIIEYAADKRLGNKIILFFSNRSEKEVIFRSRLEKIDKITFVNTLTNEKPEGWRGELGYINKGMIEKHVKEPKKYLYYICGPPPMIEAVKKALTEIGVEESRFRIENWQLPGKHDKIT